MTEYWDTDRIYTFYDDWSGAWLTFHSPDGVGKIFHTNVAEAKEQTGINSVVHLMGQPLDFCAELNANGTCIHSDHTP